MKNLVLIASFAVIAACGGSDSNRARLRVLHASPDAPAVDVLVDGSRVVSAAPFKAESGYLNVDSGSRKIQVRAAGATSDVLAATLNLTKDVDTTVIAANKLTMIEAVVATDDNTPPASGSVKVRIIHGAPSAPAVDVYVTAPGASLGTPALTNVPFKAVSAYLSVTAGDYQVRVTPAGSKTVAIDSGAVSLAAGQIRTVVAVDAPGGGSPFGAVVLADLN